MEVFRQDKEFYCETASRMFGVPVEKNGANAQLRQKSKVATLACGYGGPVGAFKAMGALDMGLTEGELKLLVDAWRAANPHVVRLWWDVDRAVVSAVRDGVSTRSHDLTFVCCKGALLIWFPSGRRLAYPRPRIAENRFSGTCVTYEGCGTARRWERIESYGPKFTENIVQATARDILAFAMAGLAECEIVMHVHDGAVIEAAADLSVEEVCERMSRALG